MPKFFLGWRELLSSLFSAMPSLPLCQKWGQCQRTCSGSPPHPVVLPGNAKARCKPQEPGNPQVQLPADKSVHSFATSTFIYHTGFHHLILFVQQLCSGSLGMQLDCWHLVARAAAAVNVSCLLWVPSLGLCSPRAECFLLRFTNSKCIL